MSPENWIRRPRRIRRRLRATRGTCRAYGNLGVVFAAQGQYEKAAEITRQALRLAPDQCSPLRESRQLHSCLAALRRGAADHSRGAGAKIWMISSSTMLSTLLPFSGRTPRRWRNSNSGLRASPNENFGLALASDTEAYGGHLAKARELTKRAVDSAIRADNKESGAIWQANAGVARSGLRQSCGSPAVSGRGFEACSHESGRRGRSRACVCHGGRYRASRIVGARPGEALPAGHADAVALAARDSGATGARPTRMQPARSDCLQAALPPIEFGQIEFVANISCLYPAYVRGEAYLAAGQGAAAAAEFQKILDHSGIVWNCWTGALAHLGVARANALQAKNLAGSGCRRRPRPRARRLQRFPYPLERCRPRHSHPETSQSRVREAAVRAARTYERGAETIGGEKGRSSRH